MTLYFYVYQHQMYEDGTCNTSIVEIMLSQINGYVLINPMI